MKLALLIAPALALALPTSGLSAKVVRHPGPPQSPILTGVTITGGTSLLLLSGQVPAVVDGTKSADSIDAFGDTKAQAISVFSKIEDLQAKQGYELKDVVKLTVFLVGDPKPDGKLDSKGFSEAYAQFFGTPPQPNKTARSVVQVAALANPGFLVEIEAFAAK